MEKEIEKDNCKDGMRIMRKNEMKNVEGEKKIRGQERKRERTN
jgi:hypothetical protein